jgi:alpha-ketoglutarate-dependent taurine dioxygenase
MKPVVTKGGSAGGAEIACDLARDIDEATLREIEAAFRDNIVVVFRRQNLSIERHIEFSRQLGTGRKSLYVTVGASVGIEGMPDDEAVDLIAELDTHCARPEFLYRHKGRSAIC